MAVFQEEYPPIGVQTGPTKPKKDGPLKKDKSEIVPNKVSSLLSPKIFFR